MPRGQFTNSLRLLLTCRNQAAGISSTSGCTAQQQQQARTFFKANNNEDKDKQADAASEKATEKADAAQEMLDKQTLKQQKQQEQQERYHKKYEEWRDKLFTRGRKYYDDMTKDSSNNDGNKDSTRDKQDGSNEKQPREEVKYYENKQQHHHHHYHYGGKYGSSFGNFVASAGIGAVFFTLAYAFDNFMMELKERMQEKAKEGGDNLIPDATTTSTGIRKGGKYRSYEEFALEYEQPLFLALLSVGIGASPAISLLLLAGDFFYVNNNKKKESTTSDQEEQEHKLKQDKQESATPDNNVLYEPIFRHVQWANDNQTLFKVFSPLVSPILGLVFFGTAVYHVARMNNEEKVERNRQRNKE